MWRYKKTFRAEKKRKGRGRPYRVALLLPGYILVDVLVSPVKHELLLLLLVHPHDGSGDLFDDALQLAQLTQTTVGHFLRQTCGKFK